MSEQDSQQVLRIKKSMPFKALSNYYQINQIKHQKKSDKKCVLYKKVLNSKYFHRHNEQQRVKIMSL